MKSLRNGWIFLLLLVGLVNAPPAQTQVFDQTDWAGMESRGAWTAHGDSARSPVLSPVGCSELIANGSFEIGEFAGWQTSGQPWLGEQAHAGFLSGALGGSNSADDQFYQQVTLPATVDSAALVFWWYVETTESGIGTPFDFLYVEVRNTSGELLSTLETRSNASTANAWQHSSIDLTAYPDLLGLTVRVVFRGATDGSNPTTLITSPTSGPTTPGSAATGMARRTAPAAASTAIPSSGPTRRREYLTPCWTRPPTKPLSGLPMGAGISMCERAMSRAR